MVNKVNMFNISMLVLSLWACSHAGQTKVMMQHYHKLQLHFLGFKCSYTNILNLISLIRTVIKN